MAVKCSKMNTFTSCGCWLGSSGCFGVVVVVVVGFGVVVVVGVVCFFVVVVVGVVCFFVVVVVGVVCFFVVVGLVVGLCVRLWCVTLAVVGFVVGLRVRRWCVTAFLVVWAAVEALAAFVVCWLLCWVDDAPELFDVLFLDPDWDDDEPCELEELEPECPLPWVPFVPEVLFEAFEPDCWDEDDEPEVVELLPI